MLNKFTIKQKILLLILLITAASVTSYTTLSYKYARDAEMNKIDDLLLTTAYGTRNVVGDDYHDSIIDSTSIKQEDYAKIAHALTDYAQNVKVKYVYTYVDYNGEMHFTSSSLNEDDIKQNRVDPFFFIYADDPEMVQNIYFKPFRDNTIEFYDYKDSYGSVRSVFIPFTTKSGKKYIIGVDYTTDYIEGLLANIRNLYLGIGISIFAIAVLIAFFMVTQISKPLKKLVVFTNELVNNDFNLTEISQNYLNKCSVNHKSEVGKLSIAFLYMQNALKKYIIDLQNTTAAKERMESELKIASTIQMGMIPKEFPAFPNNKEFNVFGIMHPAKEVGGDLYNYFFVDSDHLCFTIGDVSGKGIPAALFMAMTNTLIKANALNGKDPALILYDTNKELCRENEQMMFVTLFIGILNIKTGEVLFANAGHNPPMILRNNEHPKFMKPLCGVALGVFDDAIFTTEKIQLAHSEGIFSYTDGVTEAANKDYKLYSDDRLLSLMEKISEQKLDNMVSSTLDDISTFVDGADQSDDITILALRYN
jgi:phosphoserine phosphatase RsbU/P